LPTLPGKVPSWTPIAPLIGWVERKHLSWTDKETGKALTVAESAYLIRGKIKREAIANVLIKYGKCPICAALAIV